MATIVKQVDIDVAPQKAWDAVRDWGAVHQRLCPGVLTDATVEGLEVVTLKDAMALPETGASSGSSSCGSCSTCGSSSCCISLE